MNSTHKSNSCLEDTLLSTVKTSSSLHQTRESSYEPTLSTFLCFKTSRDEGCSIKQLQG